MEIGVGVVEILRDRAVRPGIDLGLEGLQVLVGVARLRMHLGVGGDFDVECVAAFLADEAHQVRRKAEFARNRDPGGHVAAQRDDAADAVRPVLRDHVADVFPRGSNAGNMRHGSMPFRLDFKSGRERAFARRASRAESHGEERGLQLRELPARGAQLLHPLRRLRREELETEGAGMRFLRFHSGQSLGATKPSSARKGSTWGSHSLVPRANR